MRWSKKTTYVLFHQDQPENPISVSCTHITARFMLRWPRRWGKIISQATAFWPYSFCMHTLRSSGPYSAHSVVSGSTLLPLPLVQSSFPARSSSSICYTHTFAFSRWWGQERAVACFLFSNRSYTPAWTLFVVLMCLAWWSTEQQRLLPILHKNLHTVNYDTEATSVQQRTCRQTH